eukprot:2720292-Rhodomonas_salina.2
MVDLHVNVPGLGAQTESTWMQMVGWPTQCPCPPEVPRTTLTQHQPLSKCTHPVLYRRRTSGHWDACVDAPEE